MLQTLCLHIVPYSSLINSSSSLCVNPLLISYPLRCSGTIFASGCFGYHSFHSFFSFWSPVLCSLILSSTAFAIVKACFIFMFVVTIVLSTLPQFLQNMCFSFDLSNSSS